jgi:hypothetical protein
LKLALAVSAANALTAETGFYRAEDLPWLLDHCQVNRLNN